jgi:iron complex transport system permease protein
MAWAALLTAVLFALSLLQGRGLSAFDPAWWRTLATTPGLAGAVFLEIRLPRAVLGLVVGGGLGLAGAVLQGMLRNPLADPGLFGTSGGAALGAVVVLYFGLAGSSLLMLPVGGLAGAAAALLLLFALAGWNASTLTLLLAGIAISALAGALTSLALNLAPNPFASYEIVAWMLGSLTDRSLAHVWVAAPPILAGGALLLSLRRPLDALTLGEDTAATLGVDVRRTRALAVIGTTLVVGAAVAVSGIIGFVGLVAPHLVRRRFGAAPGDTLLPAALAGACILLAADVAVRALTLGPELKLGVLTALLGAPIFMRLIRQSRREGF